MSSSVSIIRGAKQIATGFAFTEGPVWVPDAGSLIFSDIPGDSMYRWDERSGAVVFRRPSNKANGSTLDLMGRLVSCEHATSRVVRQELDGRLSIIASRYKGARLNSPNDVIVTNDGAIWFTDPDFGTRLSDMGVVRPREQDVAGVYRVDPESGELELMIEDLTEPNGLCVDDTGNFLFANDTATGLVHRYRIAYNENRPQLEDSQVWADIPGDETGSVDGLKIDSAGNVYCTGPGGIVVLNREGVQTALVEIPEKVGNFTWGDHDYRSLFACATTSVYRVRVDIPGLPLH